MGFAGRLEGIAPSDIFQIISQGRMTGTLIARCQDGTSMVVFKNGRVIEAASDTPEESLGYFLVSQGLANKETIETARARLHQEPGRPLGAILVDKGVISERTLEAVVFKQIGRIVHRLISCENGFFTFDSGEMALKRKLNTREFFLPGGVSAEYLMMERARAIDEDRRSGQDRRVPASCSASGGDPAGEREQPAPGAPQLPSTWFRRTRLRETARFAADLVRRLASRINTAWSSILPSSPDSRPLIIAGIACTVTGAAFILLIAFSVPAASRELVVTGRVVNIRAAPSPAAKVLAKTERGKIFSSPAFKDGWHQVRTTAGSTGWIAERLAERKKGKQPVYVIAFFGIVLVAGLAFLIAAIKRKGRTLRL